MGNIYRCHKNKKDHKRLLSTIYANKLDNLEEMNIFLETYNLTEQNHEEIKNLKQPITIKKTESVIQSLPTRKNAEPEF